MFFLLFLLPGGANQMIVRIPFVFALSAVLVLSSTSALATTLSYLNDDETFLSNDDNRGPGVGHGSSSSFDVRWYDDGNAQRVRIGLIRWDISGIDPSLNDYSTATMKLGFRNGDAGPGSISVYGLNDDVVADRLTGRQGNDWDPGTITFENAPGIDNDAPLHTFEILASETELLGKIVVPSSGANAVTSNTTDLPLEDFLNADTDGLVNFLLINETLDNEYYRVRANFDNSGSGPPMLNFTKVPEPSTVALVLIGLVAAAPLTRRR